ncbi:MAG: tRNA dihydrouridine(20/20a) synthase DusA [Alphaproteobacteria bacterium]|nr:tRNA dihydrouridine(20/20a) synthase DusA [Alphaproteobacteria bacterium]
MDRRLSVAPMMGWTDRHERVFLRGLTRHTLLYTEMLTTGAVIHGDRERLLGFSPLEHPLALQLGGSEPQALAEAARIGAAWGYDEINLNCGCPSPRVQSGRFGACLMAEPGLVADCVRAMREAVPAHVPVTVKCRIGIDDQDPEEALRSFLDAVAAAGPAAFIVHARKAWLEGLSPKENREVPPLDHALVRAVKAERPDLVLVLNGGLGDLGAAMAAAEGLDGAMIGRAAYQTPYCLAEADARVFGATTPVPGRADAVRAYLPYVAERLEGGAPLNALTRHLLGLYHGCPGGRLWRRALTEGAQRPGAGLGVLTEALTRVEEARARAGLPSAA